MAINEDYKKVSDVGKGIATGQQSVDNDTKLSTDSAFRQAELARAGKVLADRTAAGEDVSQQEAYINRINQLNSAGQPETPVASNTSTSRDDLLKLIQDNMASQTSALTGASEASYAAQEAALQKAYNASVASEEAQRSNVANQYATNVEDVNQRRYQEKEQSNVSAEQRGIGNSAQFDALNRGTMSRASKLKLDAAQERDTALNSIAERIANLGLTRDLDIASAGAQRDYAIATGEQSANQAAFQQQYGLATDEIARDYQTSEREAGEEFSAEQSQLGRDFNAEQNQLQRDFSANESALQRGFSDSQRRASEAFQTGKIADARAYEEAQTLKAEESLWRSFYDPQSKEYILRNAGDRAEYEKYAKELEIKNEAALNSAMATRAYEDSLTDSGNLFSSMNSGQADRYNNYTMNARDIASSEDMTYDEKLAELEILMSEAESDAYMLAVTGASDSISNLANNLSSDIRKAKVLSDNDEPSKFSALLPWTEEGKALSEKMRNTGASTEAKVGTIPGVEGYEGSLLEAILNRSNNNVDAVSGAGY